MRDKCSAEIDIGQRKRKRLRDRAKSDKTNAGVCFRLKVLVHTDNYIMTCGHDIINA